MKAYIPEKMVAVSRYQNFFPTLPQGIQHDCFARMRELIEEERAYCDKAVTSAISASSGIRPTPATAGREARA